MHYLCIRPAFLVQTGSELGYITWLFFYWRSFLIVLGRHNNQMQRLRWCRLYLITGYLARYFSLWSKNHQNSSSIYNNIISPMKFTILVDQIINWQNAGKMKFTAKTEDILPEPKQDWVKKNQKHMEIGHNVARATNAEIHQARYIWGTKPHYSALRTVYAHPLILPSVTCQYPWKCV